MADLNPPAFDFGENWKGFSSHALTPERVAQSRQAFIELTAAVSLAGRTFLDIGFGQGLSLLTATSLGARSHGCDINPKCAQVLRQNLRYFPDLKAVPPAIVGSILDESVVASLRAAVPLGQYEVVHSWGVLHHTGDMDTAIKHAAILVSPGGYLILAIYNRHWSSRAWWVIKRTYVASPRWLRKVIVGLLYPAIYLAKWMVTGRNPQRQERGMDFYYDVIDWVGGYPYEYASPAEIESLVASLGFESVLFRAARVPTGCNEFVFRRHGAAASPGVPSPSFRHHE
jgi:2-polyprenyl-6-hydroxyphenyl methylase/3-demethylubiquinone-9 3-methyltransferase